MIVTRMSLLRTKVMLREAIGELLTEYSSAGAGYEALILKTIAKAKCSGNIVKVTGDVSTLPDADIRIDGVIHNVEVKLNDRAQMGGGSIGWSHERGFFPTGRSEEAKEAVRPIVELLNADDQGLTESIGAFIDHLNRLGAKKRIKKMSGFPMSGFLVRAWDDARDKGLLKPLNRTIESDVSFIMNHYAKKGTHYIQIGGRGLFYLDSNPAKLDVPQLSGSVVLELRAARSGSGGNPTGSSGSIRVQARLKITGDSPATLDDFEIVKRICTPDTRTPKLR